MKNKLWHVIAIGIAIAFAFGICNIVASTSGSI